MSLTLKQLKDVCLIYNHSYQKCRYLAQDDNDPSKYYCLKQSAKKADIDDDVVDFLKELQKKGLDIKKQNVPIGDNCDGYPILKYIDQGYDKD